MNKDYSRGLIKYTSRDYDSIMQEFWEIVPKLTDLWKPEADADPGVVIGKIIASAADMMGVNADWLANELYAPSVRQRKNAEKVLGNNGYTLGWYTAARTEVTFINEGSTNDIIDFGFNGNNFCTLNAHTDITNQPRVITYNILPNTSGMNDAETRSKRQTITENLNIFAYTDKQELAPGEMVTRVAIEGELRSYTVSVENVKKNNYIIKLPSQHIDTTAVWIKAKPEPNSQPDDFLQTQWLQVESPSDFVIPEPRFAVIYDNYSNAQIQVSNYLNQLENYDNNYLMIYWIDCNGVIGSVTTDVLTNFLPAKPQTGYDPDTLGISNLSNTVELPHTHAVTGKSPETAKEAYYNSRNRINTHDSIVTLPDFNRFLNREPGVDCGFVLDCQKALEINLAIYNNSNLTDSEKSKMYITNNEFPPIDKPIFDWQAVLDLGFDPTDPLKYVFAANFKQYTAMCFAVHNDFKDTETSPAWGEQRISKTQIQGSPKFQQYRMPVVVEQGIIKDYIPLRAMTVELDFGYLRVFPWYVVGEIYPHNPVSRDVANTLVAKVKEDLAIYFSAANKERRRIGQQPTIIEVVEVIQNADSRIKHFDAGSINNPVITYYANECDITFFNPISFCQYRDVGVTQNNIRVSPDFVID